MRRLMRRLLDGLLLLTIEEQRCCEAVSTTWEAGVDKDEEGEGEEGAVEAASGAAAEEEEEKACGLCFRTAC